MQIVVKDKTLHPQLRLKWMHYQINVEYSFRYSTVKMIYESIETAGR